MTRSLVGRLLRHLCALGIVVAFTSPALAQSPDGARMRAWFTPPRARTCGSGPGCNAAQSAAVTAIAGAVFSGSNDGSLHVYSASTGELLWEFDTNRDFSTINGVPAKGASMIGPGAVVAGGMVYVNSGYGAFGGRPGNVLLAFGPE